MSVTNENQLLIGRPAEHYGKLRKQSITNNIKNFNYYGKNEILPATIYELVIH